MFKKLIILLLLYIINIPGHAGDINQSGFEFTTDRSSIRIPVDIAHNLIVLPLRINDGPELNFILDTGVNQTILTEPLVARALDLQTDDHVYIAGLGERGIIEAMRIKDVSIEIDQIGGKNQELLVIPEDVLSLSEMFGFEVHGIIGYDFLKEFPISINYPNDFIRIYRDSDYRVRRNSHIIPFELKNNKPYIDVTLTGKQDTTTTLPLLFDLGASHTAYLNKDHYFLTSDTTIRSYLGKGISGQMMGEEGRLKQMKLSEDIIIEDPIIAYPDPDQMWIERMDIEWNGLIGGGILKRFHIIVDYSTEQIVLRKNSDFGDRFNSNISGISLTAEGVRFENYVITHVSPGSAAYEAGIRKGDKVMRINNKYAQNLSLQDILDILNSPTGTSISMTVARDYIVKKENDEEEPEKEIQTKQHSFSFNLREDLPFR